MQIDDKAINFIKKAKAAGATIDQVADFLRGKGYEFDYTPTNTPTQQTEQVPEQNGPSLLQGTSRAFATGATGGLAPWIAGIENIQARAAGAIGAAIADRDLSTLKQLDPRRYKEYYEEGKREYTQSQEQFAKEHPVANVLGETAGTIAGIGLTGGTVGAGTRAAVAGTRLGQAGLPGMIAARTAGEAAGFAAYEAARGATESGELSAKGAGTGALKGGAMGVAFGVLGGGIQAAEPGLIQQAQKLIVNPTASELLVKTLGLGAEGATIGAVPAALEGRLPTSRDILTGEAFAVGGRGVAKAGELAGNRLWRFANEPTAMQQAQIRRNIELGEKVDEATAREIDFTKERRLLEAEGADETAIREAQKTEDWYAAERSKAEEELESSLYGKPEELNVRITPTEEEITARMKDYSNNPNMTREQAKLIMQGERVTAAARTRLDPNAGLPLKERFLRGAKALTSRVIQQFNFARPVQEAELAIGAATGKKVEAVDSAVERINKLRSGGEQEALINPVLKEVERIDKQYPGSDSGARELLLAEKEVQFAKLEGREPSQRSVDVIEAFKDNKPVQDIAKQVRDMNQKVLDKLYESGRIDKTTYDAWKANDKYVPSWAEKELGEIGEQGIANNAGSFYRRYGGQALAYQNPILTSMAQAKYLDQFAEMNMAKKQYLRFERLTGKARLSETLEDYKGGAIKFDKKNQIVVWENGKPQIWDVPERVANYFNPVALPPASKVESFLKGLAASPLRFYKAGTTAASLGFAERNVPRDVAGAMFGSQWGGNLSASMLGSSAKDLVNGAPILVPFNKQFGGQTLRNVEQIPWVAEDNIKRYMDMYKAANDGTKQGSVSNILARMFTTALPNAARKVSNFSRGATRRGLDTLSYAGNLSEETTRLAVFKSVLQGRAKNEAEYKLWMERPELIPERWVAEAGKEAREATLNFRRQMAPWVETANKYFMPYFKPAILGAMRGMTMLSNPDIAPRAWRYIINTGILQGLILGDIVKGKDREDLEAINNEIIDKNFILRGKNGRLFTLPLAQELAPIVKIFSGVTEKIYRNATKQQRGDIAREMLQAGKDLLENYAPVAGYLSTPSNFVIGGPIPKTILEESVNKDFFTGTPIESKGQLGRPAYMRQTKNTPALAVQLSKTLARHNINISPLRIRHITVGLASNVAKELYAATDAVMSAYGNGPLRARKDIEDSPYARSFAVDIMAPYNQYAKDSNEIIDAAKIGKKAIDSEDEENWSEKQRKEYEMQYDIHELIKQDIDSLQQLYKKRAEYETYLAKDAEDLKKEYADKKISKAEYLSKWRELEYQLKQVTEELALEERAYQLNIIAGEKEVKESYKRAPK